MTLETLTNASELPYLDALSLNSNSDPLFSQQQMNITNSPQNCTQVERFSSSPTSTHQDSSSNLPIMYVKNCVGRGVDDGRMRWMESCQSGLTLDGIGLQNLEMHQQARGPRKHLKRLNAPSAWMLDKLSGTYAPRPSPGPHKLRESLPLTIFLRNRLKYALTGREVTAIVNQRIIRVDGKVRTDETFPTGFMDVVTIEKSGEHFRLLYDVKGRFAIHRITPEEASYKLCKVRKIGIGRNAVPHIVTHDGRTIRYPDPLIKVNDTVKFDFEQNKITDFVKFDTGNIVMVTGGRNMGRAGVIVHREKNDGGHDMVHVRDALDRTFVTRVSNIFVIGEGIKPWISLPKGKGTKLTISEERDLRRKQRAERDT
ncbi:uncharacterized protein FOMMEDRAFT_164273 [Fomitiporia mediterranea MF3/22]|uniref:uncharacterized protein n=1 Tax=Fomitiporia mediterranea (strain MF3/22) TaxID=694068 RepID=UPI00044083FE|nr:uncharacterized protein FOMMEDRAFT_164273 [Fomitiporia mediterranea MF3/22]EJD07242.1 hypothetical protein FOMMEDRAFT_164273 [Fomitiporia mediterranea MF3/22]